ncbi:MAG: PDZ domain-containing protein [Merismopedia sp. SIO2A8]|nr:PDZ domain-containing protein [Merismopedia sp. SIO2A8]
MRKLPFASSFSHQLLFSGAIATTTTLLSFLLPLTNPSSIAALENSPKAILDEAWQIIHEEYVDSSFNQLDWQAVRMELLSQDYTDTEQAYAVLQDVLEDLDDPYTRFMDPDQYEELTNQTSGEFSGVGLRLTVPEDTGILTVVEALDGSPAAAAGLTTGDRILTIDGTTTAGLDVGEAADLMTGEIGIPLNLAIERGEEDATEWFEVDLVRARLELPTVNYALREEGQTDIGYIRLSEFSAHAPEQMAEAIADLNDSEVDAFILDLRGNPGGLLRSSIDISRMWLEDGAIVQTVDRHGESEEVFADGTALTQLPLAVLVDGHSASSSEIVTGALADNERAIVVGHKTFGKALVQAVHSLSDGSGLAVTVAHYYTPDGTDISQRGISPDVTVTLTLEQHQRLVSDPALQGTYGDPYYRQALEALQPQILANWRRTELSQSTTDLDWDITE